MKGRCTDQQEKGTVKLRGKGERAWFSKHGSFNRNTIQSRGTAAIPLCTSLLCVKDAGGGRREGEGKGTMEILVLLLSHRSKEI